MKTILLVGGDRRSLYLRAYFERRGFSTYGFALQKGEPPALGAELLQKPYAAVLLPLPVTRDGQTVCTPLWDGALPLAELCRRLPKGARVLGGQVPKAFSEQLLAGGCTVLDYCTEAVVRENADLTARGVLRVLQENGCAPKGARVVVTGFGRVAKATLKALLAAGAAPLVAARRQEALREAEAQGAEAVLLSDFLKAPGRFDALVNTVPARLFSERVLRRCPPDALYLEAASAPYGLDLAAAKRLGRRAVLAASLPGRYFPQAAAEILGAAAESLL